MDEYLVIRFSIIVNFVCVCIMFIDRVQGVGKVVEGDLGVSHF